MLIKKTVLLISILLTSCVSKSIINDNSKYYSETNILEKNDNEIILRQRVRNNDVKNGLHSGWNYLTVSFLNASKLRKGKVFTIKKDTVSLKVKYKYSSVRALGGVYAKNISGTIKIIDLEEEFIEIMENIYVVDEFNEKVVFKGTRMFWKNKSMKEYPDMKRNRKRLWLLKNKG